LAGTDDAELAAVLRDNAARLLSLAE